MKSNCKHNEDLELFKYSEGIPKTIIDIGASDGKTNSNSKLFIDLGWEAILIEPQPDKYKDLVKNTKLTNNVYCLNVAISENTGETDFLINPIVNDHSRLPNDNYYSERFGHLPVSTIKVKTWSPNTLFKNYPEFKNLGILSIDTEGYDEMILRELIKTHVRPYVIICEHHTKETRMRQKEILTEYEAVKKISANEIYVWKQ